MKGIKLDIDQQTDEWFYARLGVITASKLGKCFTPKLAISKPGVETLARTLAGELIYKHNNELPENFQNYAMMRGSSLEREARDIFKFNFPDHKVDEGGFYFNEEFNVGASPDVLLYSIDGLEIGAEIKCPLPKGHVDNLLEEGTPSDHMIQVHLSMLVLGVEQWLFCSYCPGVKMKIFKQELDAELVDKIKEVIGSVNEKLATYRALLEV